jgi:PAS domain S-box-containing protein
MTSSLFFQDETLSDESDKSDKSDTSDTSKNHVSQKREVMSGALRVIQGKKKGETLPLKKEEQQTIIGRDSKCDIQLDDPEISRRHFCILAQENKFFLQDMGSSNGTFMNGQQAVWQEIKPGDHISCGTTELEFFLTDSVETVRSVGKEAKRYNTAMAPDHANTTQPIDLGHTGRISSTHFFPEIEDRPPDIILKKNRQEPPFSEYGDVNRLSKALSTLYKVLELINSQLQLKQLLEVLLETVLEITKAERGCLILQKSECEAPETVAFRSTITGTALPFQTSKTIVNFAIEQGVATVSADAMSDHRFRKNDHASVVIQHIRSVMCAPLEGRERILGAIYVDSIVNCYAFDNEDLELLRAIGRQAGLAVERALLQEEISRSEQKYRTIFEKSPFCIVLISQSGRVLDINPVGLGNLGSQALPKRLEQCSILDLFPTMKSSFQKLLQEGESFEVKEFPATTFEGNNITLRLKATPLKNDRGIVEGGMLIAEDITQAKKMQSQIIQQDKMAAVGLLAAGVAHEFNNIIAGMMGYAQLTIKNKKGTAGEDPAQELANIVVEQCKRAKEVIERLLNFSRRKDTPRELVRLDALLEDVFQLVRRELLKNNIQVVRKFNNVPLIPARPGQLQQIFLNLVINAMQAMANKQNGTLTVTLRLDEECILVSFQDTGAGIPPKILPRIFEPFFSTKGNQGTGLGLSVSYSIIQEYGGEITVESKENEGTNFTIWLPLQQIAPSPPTPTDTPIPPATPTQPA